MGYSLPCAGDSFDGQEIGGIFVRTINLRVGKLRERR
jgi:hypothetical protein